MANPPVVIMNSGGIRSLVATAATLSGMDRPNVILLHLLDGRANVKARSEYVDRQAKHFDLRHVVEIDLSHRSRSQTGNKINTDLAGIPQARVLIDAITRAIEANAGRLVWPAQSNGNFDVASRITEQVILVQHLARLEHPYVPTIESPLTELTDQQLIELGGQLDVPWEHAWSCQIQGEQPCRVCDGCRRRVEAFESAGMIDPASPLATVR